MLLPFFIPPWQSVFGYQHLCCWLIPRFYTSFPQSGVENCFHCRKRFRILLRVKMVLILN